MSRFSQSDCIRIGASVRATELLLQDQSTPADPSVSTASDLPIAFYNSSAETIPPFGVMKVTGGGVMASGAPYLTCAKPDGSGTTYAVNSARQVASHKWGQANVAGWARVAYDSGTPAVGESWGAKSGQWTATKGPFDAIIYGVVDATHKIAFGLLQKATGGIVSGVLDGALNAGSSATLSVWELAAGQTDWVSHSADTTRDVIVYAPAVFRSGTIAAGKWVEAMQDAQGVWRVRWAECD
jgi:hypothetical protein